MVRWMILLVVVLLAGFFVYVKMNNQMPEGLGVTNGQLKLCSGAPNCVSTQADQTDEAHFAEPLVYSGRRQDVQLRIEAYMLRQGAKLVDHSLGYAHFEVESDIVGYIDDVEFYLPKSDSVVHIRSASRVGYSDFGINRDRVRQIQDLLVD
ncbi:DUF1499 domain-containing protein [Marinomonas aquiplantarum]|uniref:Uncharacterized protein (DUF1499 family) n=1 Tax=Marinomonas aquiplantarum TaxID=491951 RepID=A0A366D054_9GAMM|nr:DUF1499 domain-containing protein [Marinomonas aquiplantarum]RBO83275.1 uncharacterized protein (DUF1499 family) [Marinomonas aquiplantarum]